MMDDLLSCLGALIILIGLIFLASFIVMDLWNWLLPKIWTDIYKINIWEAMGMIALCKILFGSTIQINKTKK